MSRILYLLRHAKAQLGDANMRDHERPLAPRGVDDARRLGLWMQQQSALATRVVCSSSLRTRETLAYLNESLEVPLQAHMDDNVYLASPGELLSVIQETDDATNSLMLIGHNPGIHQLALTLTSSAPPDALETLESHFPTCTLAVLHLHVKRWSLAAPQCATLEQLILRKTLQASG